MRFTQERGTVYRDGKPYAHVHLGANAIEDGRRASERIADALNAAEENKDRSWVGDGPTVEEAGGESILVRMQDGDLVRARWKTLYGVPGWVGDHGYRITAGAEDWTVPTGWRRMPAA